LVTVIAYLLYPTITGAMFQSLSCENELLDGESHSWLKKDLDISCTSAGHISYICLVVVPVILLYVAGFPIISIILVARSRARIKVLQKDLSSTDTFDIHKMPEKSKFRFSVLLSGYTDDKWYWEGWICARKVVLTLIAVFFSNFGTELQFFFASLILVIATVAQIHYRPFRSMSINLIESVGLICIFGSLFMGLFFYWNLLPEDGLYAIGIVIVVVNIMFVSLAIGTILRDMLERRVLGHKVFHVENAKKSSKFGKFLRSRHPVVVMLLVGPYFIFYVGCLFHELFVNVCTKKKGVKIEDLKKDSPSDVTSTGGDSATADEEEGKALLSSSETAAQSDEAQPLFSATESFMAQNKLQQRRNSLKMQAERQKQQEEFLASLELFDDEDEDEDDDMWL